MGFDWDIDGFNLANPFYITQLCIQQTQKIMKEEIYYVADSLGVMREETIERQAMSIPDLFISGGSIYMVIITLFLIAVFVAAWKAPRWVKEIGIGALVFSIFSMLLGLYQMFDICQLYGDVQFSVMCGGLKCGMIPILYGLIVYFISLVIRVIQKPRI